jgi:hypothetical protein
MKFSILLAWSLLASQFLFSQSDSTKNVTAVEAFLNVHSSLIYKTFYTVGNSRQFEVKVLTIKDMMTEKIEKGLVIAWSNPLGTYSTSDYRVFLDSDEVEDVLKAVTKMVTIVKANVQENYSEYNFTTRGGFRVSIFSDVGKPWRASIEKERFSNSFKSFQPQELDNLLQSLIKGRDRIK